MLKIINTIIEIITAPFTMLVKSNGISVDTNKLIKPIIILLISIVIVGLLVLFFYWNNFFKQN
jgi:hypothetical protein